jgi:biotin transporter BioY
MSSKLLRAIIFLLAVSAIIALMGSIGFGIYTFYLIYGVNPSKHLAMSVLLFMIYKVMSTVFKFLINTEEVPRTPPPSFSENA